MLTFTLTTQPQPSDLNRQSGLNAYRWMMTKPCKNGQPLVAADGSCLRCGADQGVRGYACPTKTSGSASVRA